MTLAAKAIGSESPNSPDRSHGPTQRLHLEFHTATYIAANGIPEKK